jgi:hypothetical protein
MVSSERHDRQIVHLEVQTISMMRLFILSLLLYSNSSQFLFATAQFPELLIVEKDTIKMYTNPLEAYFERKGERSIGNIEMVSSCTALWRGYVATWKLTNDSLFLVGIKISGHSKTASAIGITEEFKSSSVFANWVSLSVICPYGNLIQYMHQGYSSIYEYEKEFEFINGLLKSAKVYNNSASKLSAFTENTDTLWQFIYQNMDWAMIEEQKVDRKSKIVLQIQPDATGKIKDVQVIRGANMLIDNEVKRVIRLIPHWTVYYRRGEFLSLKWILPIALNQQFYTDTVMSNK